MIRSFFKIAWRHLLKSKLYAFVNIIGLAIGITACLLIGLYITHEWSFDRFHKNANRIARVTWHYNFESTENKTALTGTKVGPALTRQFPEIETYVRTLKYPRVVTYNDKMFEEKNFFYADSAFFNVFSFSILEGNPVTVLDAPDKIVLTQSTARKYFGTENPIGKTVKVGGTKDFQVTGITADPPDNSQLKFDMVASFTSLNAAKTEKWNEANYITYLLLKQPNQFTPLQNKITPYAKQVGQEEMKLQGHQYMNYVIEPLTKVHLYSELEGFEPNNSITYIYIMAIVALLILLVAGVNYTNLSAAQSANRRTEIGMRKVMGAEKRQLFYQFIVESFILSLIAVVLALLISVFILPYFNQISGKEFQISDLFKSSTIIALIVVAAFIAFTSGTYPALILSRSKIIQVLKSGFRFTDSGSLRRSLIVFQFVISIFLIIATIIIIQQLNYIRNKDLGYNKDQVLVIPVDRLISERYDDIKSALKLTPGVTSVGGAYEVPTNIGWSDGVRTKDGKSISVNAYPVDEDALNTLGVKFIAGSNYTISDAKAVDTSQDGKNLRYQFILNESAAKALGWTPEEAIGKPLEKNVDGTVKAVVKDFHFRSFHEPINPLVIFLDKRLVSQFFVKINSSNVSGTLARLEETWKQRVKHRPFEYQFLDENYDSLYKTETRVAHVFTTFSTLAILLACLGLFALTAYSMVRRTKEIGIRKILGASVGNILTLVSKEFLQLVLVALVVSVPIAAYAVSKWLQTFSYRIQIEWWVFAAAGIITLVIAFLTICVQAFKTAITNPVKNLRTE